MPIALIATSTKKQNGIYCCIIHKTKYIVDILCTVITFLNNKINLHTKKCFFQTCTIAISIFLRNFFIIMIVNFEIFIKTHVLLYLFLLWNQKQPLEVFYEKAVLKNFAIFTGKHLCWSLFLIKLQTFRPDSKKDSNTDIFLWMLRNVEKHLFWRTSGDGCF